jgi:hypothetical protein
MEHRTHQRIAAHHAVWIQIGEIPPLPATTGNVSRDGLLLKLTHPSLKPSAVVKVIMEHPLDRSLWKSSALVVHTSASGTGVLLSRTLPLELAAAPRVINF